MLPYFTPANTSTTGSLKENTPCQTSCPGYQGSGPYRCLYQSVTLYNSSPLSPDRVLMDDGVIAKRRHGGIKARCGAER